MLLREFIMEPKIKSDLEEFILNILVRQNTVTVPEIELAARLSTNISTNRRAIQRELQHLIQERAIIAYGKARARFYTLAAYLITDTGSLRLTESAPSFVSEKESVFNYSFLSNESSQLLQYVSKPILARKPVGYHQDFLRTYQPNQSFYLTSSLRKKLLITGAVENVMRPAGTYVRSILNRILVDLSWNSSRLEGNTYSLLETKRLIEFGEIAVGKNASEAQMILNHKDAIEYIINSIDEPQINSQEIYSIHALLSENLLGDPSASGRLRSIAVRISGSTYEPLENQHILKESFDIFIKKLNCIIDPFEQSFFALVHLSYLQAFEDVNKRTSRLVANIPLIKQNLKPLSFTDVDQNDYAKSLLGIYEKNDVGLLRNLYEWAYIRSSQRYSAIQQNMGEPNLFKLKYRDLIHEIVQEIILTKIIGSQVVTIIKNRIHSLRLPKNDDEQLFKIIEIELASLHDGNIARYKIRPSEFNAWKVKQML